MLKCMRDIYQYTPIRRGEITTHLSTIHFGDTKTVHKFKIEYRHLEFVNDQETPI